MGIESKMPTSVGDIESYWEGLRPPREPEAPSPTPTLRDDHLKPIGIVGLVYAGLEDKQEAYDIHGDLCIVFKPKWYELHRWFCWLFIVGGRLSSYQWTVANTMNGYVRASKRIRLPPWV